MRFSTPLLAAGLTVSALASPLTTTTKRATTFQFFGVNESGAEFGQANIPDILGTDYTWPSTTAIGTLMDKGMTTFRIPFLMERLAQGTMTSTLDATYLAALKEVVSYITGRGGYAVLDPHNFGRYAGSIITSTTDFETFWTNVGTTFKSDAKVIFDCNNEYHDMGDDDLTRKLNQACIDGVRGAGASEQYIFVEGTVCLSLPPLFPFFLFLTPSFPHTDETSHTQEHGPGSLPETVLSSPTSPTPRTK